jgi:exodeoxyribonuclease VII large subunit
MVACLEKRRRTIHSLGQLLRSLSHKSVLDRGFTLVRDAEGRMLRRVAEAEAAGSVELEFADGRALAEVQSGGAAGPRPSKPARETEAAAARRSKKAKQKQGQLF